MKKIFFTSILLLAITSSSTHKAHAQWTVFDPANFNQNILGYVKQGLQYASEVIRENAAVITMTKTVIRDVNDNVLNPMNSVLTLRAIIASNNGIQNLVRGTMGQENALLVADPEEYLRNKSNGVTQQAIGSLTEQNGPYSDSVMANLIQRSRSQNRTLDDRVAHLNQSNIPAMEQKRRCTDAALSSQAEKDISNSSGIYTQEEYRAAYTARKKELNDALCGDLSDPNTQAALTAINKQNPSLDSLLAMTSCDNEFCRSQRIEQEVEARKNQVAQAAVEDLKSGGGLRSVTTCTKRVATKIDGTKYDTGDLTAPCISEKIAQTASSINKSFQESFDTIKPQLATIGNNASGIMSVVGAAMNTLSLTQQIGNQLGVGGGGGTGTGGGTGGYTNDLLNDTSGKANLTKTPLDFLAGQKSSLNELSSWETKHLESINTEKLQMDNMVACYESIKKDYPDHRVDQDSEYIAAHNFYNAFYQTEINGAESTQGKILKERELVRIENTLIDQTVTKIHTSNSTEEIMMIFQDFQSTQKTQGLPEGIVASAVRKGEYYNHSGRLEQSLLQGGNIHAMNAKCQTLRTEHCTQRNKETGENDLCIVTQ